MVVPATEKSGNAFLIEPFWEQAGWRRVRSREELARKGPGGSGVLGVTGPGSGEVLSGC